MKLLIAILFLPAICFSQSLSQITTKKQAEKYIVENFKYYRDYRYNQFTVEDTVSASVDNFKHGDFNHDGIEDLMVFGTAVVMRGKDQYTLDEIAIIVGDKRTPRKVHFPYEFFEGIGIDMAPFPKIINAKEKDYIMITYNMGRVHIDDPLQVRSDTLFVDLNDNLIPFSSHPSDKSVVRVEFKTDYCYGTCPVFELTIDSDLNADYNGIKYVDKTGLHRLKADKKDWDYITQLISHLNIENLENNYAVRWTDYQTGTLTVVFKNGDKKTIEDYGMKGSFGLSLLYDYFFELSKF
jgi:hypothetical protein